MQLNLCRHIKTNGLQCRGVAVTGSPFCYFHRRLHRGHVPYHYTAATQGYLMPGQHIELCPLEDRESVQLALSKVINALATGNLETKKATAIIYGLQLAARNAARLDLEPTPHAAVREILTTPADSETPGLDLARPGIAYDLDFDPDEIYDTADPQNPPTRSTA
jgi:hypothetical protein